MNREKLEELRSAIEDVIGLSAYVLVYDSTTIDEMIKGDRTTIDYAEPRNQAAYATLGLLNFATNAYSELHEEDD